MINYLRHCNFTSLIRGGRGQKQFVLTHCTQLCHHCDDKITCTSFGPLGSTALENNYTGL